MPQPIPDLSRDQQCFHYQAPTGERCGSPALKGQYYCYHHIVKNAARSNRTFLIDPEITCMEIPPIEDRASIFIALAAVVHRLAENTIDTRRAGQMIYGLQVAMRALEPPPSQRCRTSPETKSASQPTTAHPTKSCHSERAQRAEEPREPTPTRAANTTPPPDPPAPTTISISKQSLLYFLRSRHCASCNAELFPANQLTERPNPGAPPEIIEEARRALPAPEAVILSEAPSLGEGAQSKDPETLHPATANYTFQAQPQSRCLSAELSGTAPTHSDGTLPSLQAVAENRQQFNADRDLLLAAATGPASMKKKKSGEPRLATFRVSALNYLMISLMVPAPTVRPPSRMAKRRPFSMATGVCSVISN